MLKKYVFAFVGALGNVGAELPSIAENTLNMLCVLDNLRKGVALDTVQVACKLINRGLVKVKKFSNIKLFKS